MAKALIPDELWPLIAAHCPVHPPSPKGGRPRIRDRAARTGILFVLKTGIPWEYLPRELGCGSGMTCWRLLHEWMLAGVWQSIHEATGGVKFEPHRSHKTGLEVDVRPIRKDGKRTPVYWQSTDQYDQAATAKLIELFRAYPGAGKVDFNDPDWRLGRSESTHTD